MAAAPPLRAAPPLPAARRLTGAADDAMLALRAALDIMTGEPDENAGRVAPQGLLAMLVVGQTPRWLQPVSQTIGSNIVVFQTAN